MHWALNPESGVRLSDEGSIVERSNKCRSVMTPIGTTPSIHLAAMGVVAVRPVESDIRAACGRSRDFVNGEQSIASGAPPISTSPTAPVTQPARVSRRQREGRGFDSRRVLYRSSGRVARGTSLPSWEQGFDSPLGLCEAASPRGDGIAP